MKEKVRLFMTGFGMGAADIVPGVSGGTIAFIFGIYEELIYSIKKVSGEVLKLIFQRRFREAFENIPFAFLIPLGLGISTALITLARLLSHLLDTQPTLVWSFFFGLVVASVLIVRKRVVTWDLHDVLLMILATIIAYYIVGAVPVQTPATSLAFFLAGAIAIVAMILPGISGSFILVLMGKYEQVLEAVVNAEFAILALVIAGAVVGLSVFSRVLSWLFEKHHDISVVILTGLMIGSLRKIWPWKEVLSTTVDRHGVEIPLQEANVLPGAYDSSFFTALSLFTLAIIIMLYLEKLNVTDEDVELIDDPKYERMHKKALRKQLHE
jgi:putative membrane protein